MTHDHDVKLSLRGFSRERVCVRGEGGSSPPPQLGGLGERYELPSGVRAEPRLHKGFPLFSAHRMASPDNIILLILSVVKYLDWYNLGI